MTLPVDIRELAGDLAEIRDVSPHLFRATIRAVVRSLLGYAAGAVWAPWLELASTEFLFVGFESNAPHELAAQLPSICAQAAGVASDDHSPGTRPFPGETPAPYWATWQSVNQPPPLQRAAPVAPCPRHPEWEAPDYDVPAWDILYQVTVRMTHIGDFDAMDLYPLAGVDPIILRDPPTARLDHALPGGKRPPMGFAVARLLARQIAYDYSEHGEHAMAAWIFAHINDAGPPPRARAPEWLTASLSVGFAALRPDAMFAFCERAFEDLDRRWAQATQ